MPYETTTIDVEPGSVLALYTDGLVQRATHDVCDGLQRLTGALATSCHPGRALEETGRTLLDNLVDEAPLPGELFDALGEHSQGRVGGLGHRVLAVLAGAWAEACAGAEQLAVAQSGQSFPQCGNGDDQDGFELVDRLGTSLDRGVLGELVHPGAVHWTVAGLGPGPGAATEHGSRGGRSPACATTPEPRRTTNAAPRKARPGARSSDASKGRPSHRPNSSRGSPVRSGTRFGM
ncbi:SpoIIE family protein phosphatase [Streptomyces sp. NPDC001450]